MQPRAAEIDCAALKAISNASLNVEVIHFLKSSKSWGTSLR
jgi:hypothetical protein